MHVGLLRVDLRLPAAQSLKDKRRQILRLRERIKQKFNVSISEVGEHDKWQRLDLAIVMVNTDRVPIDQVFGKILSLIAGKSDVEILDQRIEFL
jgi:hypothetical protein